MATLTAIPVMRFAIKSNSFGGRRFTHVRISSGRRITRGRITFEKIKEKRPIYGNVLHEE